MFSKLANYLDFQKNEIRNAILQVLGAAPGTPVQGQMYFDSVLLAPRFYDGTSLWTNKATDSLLLGGSNSAFYLARGNHTGSQVAATISDLATVVQGYNVGSFAKPVASFDFNSQRGINQLDPVNPQDSATRNYVDVNIQLAAAGIDSKPSVRVVATANLALTGAQTIDGVACVAGDRVLAAGQTTASQNGVYVVAAGAWARAVDADQTGELTPGATWFVEEGTANAASNYRVSGTGAITVGTTAITIVKSAQAIAYTASLGVQLVGSDFRAAVAASGGVLAGAGGLSVDRSIIPARFAGNFGNGALLIIPVAHNLNTTDVIVSVKDIATSEFEGCKVVVTDANTVTLTFSVAPAANAIRVVVVG